MNKKGPIVIIEDNEEDRKLFAEIFSDLNYPIKCFVLVPATKHINI